MSLVELMFVVALVGILILMGGHTLQYTANRTYVKSCAQGLAMNIDLARTYAQREGQRAVIQLSNGTGSENIDGDLAAGNAVNEYYIAFLDSDSDDVFDAGEEAFIHGTPGDPICDAGVTVDGGTTVAARTLVFSNQGSIISGGANRNIYLKCGNEAARLEIISLTGMTRILLNDDGCGADQVCGINDTWVEIK
jgi:Tfp pilus assembly protein FimT